MSVNLNDYIKQQKSCPEFKIYRESKFTVRAAQRQKGNKWELKCSKVLTLSGSDDQTKFKKKISKF